MNWDDLTEDQQRAARSAARRLLVFGGAGSGKTTVALWCAKAFLESGASGWNRVLFLTFSRTAVREIATRSGRSLAEVRERIEVHTFHAFANRLISAFGRFVGLGSGNFALQSDAQAKVLGRDREQIRYDDLLPMALTVVRDPQVRRLLAERWPLVICDEFQDTDDLQWELLTELSGVGRLVLFADPNQMIYTFLRSRGVGRRRIDEAKDLAELVVDLGEPSHRDPTNIIPSMAQAVRRREFDSEALWVALEQRRLQVVSEVGDDALVGCLLSQIADARNEGASSIGVFGHTNQGVADLSAELTRAGLDHALVGLPEAHGEALAALEVLCLHGLGERGLEDVREQLAVFVTSAVRGKQAPDIAQMLVGRLPLPGPLEKRLTAASSALKAAAGDGLEELVRTAARVWPELGINPGRRPWSQAARTFGAAAQQIIVRSRGRIEPFTAELGRVVAAQRADGLLDLDIAGGAAVQIMNFHQTKGREADVVILVYRDGDWFGNEGEPFPDNSRVLYVSLTRARRRAVVLLPEEPHPLVAPLRDFGQPVG